MQDLSEKYFLMIEPDDGETPSQEPVEDELTKKVEYLFSICKKSEYSYRGWHITRCGKHSDNHDWILPNGVITNSLCTYYIRHYRQHIPEIEIHKINTFYLKYGPDKASG